MQISDAESYTPGPTFPQVLLRTAARAGGFTFQRPDGREESASFDVLVEQINDRARQLLAHGMKKGDRLGLVLADVREFVLSFIGAMAAGVVPVPMYPPLSLGKLDSYAATAAHILEAARARWLLTDRRALGVLWSLANRVRTLEAVLAVEDLPAPSGPQPNPNAIGLDDLAFLQFTSGSTSAPKGVMVTHKSLAANLQSITETGLRLNPDDSAVSWLPLYHDMGLIGFVLAPLWYGTPTTLIPTVNFVKHPTIWLETMSRKRATVSFAPNFAFALAVRRTSPEKLKELDLSCIRLIGCGAEPNHPGTLRAFLEHFGQAGLKPTVLLPSYGMAEATLAITFHDLDAPLRVDRVQARTYHDSGRALPAANGESDDRVLEFVSCGRAQPGHEVEIVDARGKPVGERETGEILFRGGSVTAGYFEQAEATAATFGKRGLHTGDLGYLADGELFVTGRKKDIIILNGRNYDPQSIEWEAAEVFGIRKGNVVAFSRPGSSSEELVVVAETREREHERVVAALRQRIQESLFLHAADVVLLAPGQLPKTSSGKLQRRRTRQQYLEGALARDGVRTVGERAQTLTIAKYVASSALARLRYGMKRWRRGTASVRSSKGERT